MKNLLKTLALWLVKISGINLVEPYTLEHLKKMIHSVTSNYEDFKYQPFLVEIKAMHSNKNVTLTIPFLIDCPTIEDAKKIIENVRNRLDAKDYFTSMDTEKNIHYIKEAALLTEEFKQRLAKVKLLMGYMTFKDKIEQAKKIVKDSPFFLTVDILSGTSEIKRVEKLSVTATANYPGIQIGLNEINF